MNSGESKISSEFFRFFIDNAGVSVRVRVRYKSNTKEKRKVKRLSTAKVVKSLGDGNYEDVRIIEVSENEEDPSEMYGFWKDQLEGSLKDDELVMVVTEYI